MIKIEGDHVHIYAISQTDYSVSNNGQPGLKIQICLMHHISELLKRCETMEREWQEHKQLINSNAAVKNAWDHYQLLIQLAEKEKT
jgi:hypothetical protein